MTEQALWRLIDIRADEAGAALVARSPHLNVNAQRHVQYNDDYHYTTEDFFKYTYACRMNKTFRALVNFPGVLPRLIVEAFPCTAARITDPALMRWYFDQPEYDLMGVMDEALESVEMMWVLIASLRRFRMPVTSNPPAGSRCLANIYHDHPNGLRMEARKSHGCEEYGPLSVFLYIILLCDEYFTLKEQISPCGRFFACCLCLPLELQTVLCRRMFGLSGNTLRSCLITWGLKIYVADGWLQ